MHVDLIINFGDAATRYCVNVEKTIYIYIAGCILTFFIFHMFLHWINRYQQNVAAQQHTVEPLTECFYSSLILACVWPLSAPGFFIIIFFYLIGKLIRR